ncbi:MAG: lasso RiPP family leader peptide-containing protein [Terriglobales bacterium]
MRTDDRSQGEQLVSKKAYAPPKLTEYGSVAKLTEGSTGTASDFGNIQPNKPPSGSARRR